MSAFSDPIPSASAQTIDNTISNNISYPLLLLKAPWQAIQQVETFTFVTLPHNVARFTGLDVLFGNGLGREGELAAAAAATGGNIAEGIAENMGADAAFNVTDFFQAMKRFSGFFSYMTSRWSLACFSVALVLNRVTIYASSRRHITLPWKKRLVLRIIPITLFLAQIVNLLRAIRCQTSPEYPSIRYGHPDKRFSFDHAAGGGFLYSMSSTLLPWESYSDSCSAVGMSRQSSGTEIPRGSFNLLWPVFITLCISHFVETLLCALQGRPVVTEAGMSIFEHSLAFAEAETMVSQSIGLGIFGLTKHSSTRDDLPLTGDENSTLHILTRTQVLEKMNVTPELNHCLLGIYGLAVLISAFNLPAGLLEPSSIWERFSLAHDNMQGSNQIRNVRLNMHEDFYTSLLRIGYASLTAASEAVFLNEGRNVVARRRTWLEEDRLTEIENARRRVRPRTLGSDTSAARWDNAANINFDIPLPQAETWESGYGKEQKIEKLKNIYQSHSQNNLGGVGAFHGASRVYHGWIALGLDKILERMGITSRPRWMVRLIGTNKKRKTSQREQQASLDFWILTDDGELELPEDDEFDVEKEMRKRETMLQSTWEDTDETRLDNKLYNWWTAGGSWGNQDESGEYVPSEDSLDDNTSVISMQTNNDEWEDDDDDSDGRRTPTQREPYPRTFTRESTPLMETLLDTSSLARLLDPRDQESKNEARILAAHLLADREGRIMTRSRFRCQDERERARVLMPARYHARSRDRTSNSNEKSRPTAEEEADILEKLILTRRQDAAARIQEGQKDSWETGAAGLGDDGPQCVICQTSPRSIIAWPCRCLCVCEDCRVSLAMNNFGSCVTCRQEVAGFVRLWVP
uniref:Protein ASI3 n=2 Tax=Talaromyces marneffei PM1 TaxID=1077442 RepID=A0A093VH68_TALMA